MPNPNPVDDLDFTSQAPSPSPKKGMSRRGMRGIAMILLVLASGLGGYAINSLARVTPEKTVPATMQSALSHATYVDEYYADSNYGDLDIIYVKNAQYSRCGYMTFPLTARPQDFTSARINLRCKGYNYTWVNISLVTTEWNYTTITWNTRPAPGPQIACIPVQDTAYIYPPFRNATFDVTTWVGSGTNLSICIQALYNNTRADFDAFKELGFSSSLFLEWSYNTQIGTDPSPIITIAFAAAIAVVALILMMRKPGGK